MNIARRRLSMILHSAHHRADAPHRQRPCARDVSIFGFLEIADFKRLFDIGRKLVKTRNIERFRQRRLEYATHLRILLAL